MANALNFVDRIERGERRGKRGGTYSLEDLLAPDILQTRVEVLDPLGDVLELALVGALDLAGLADGEVEGELDAAVGVGGVQPALAAAVAAWREAEPVVARVGRREGEAPRGRAPLRDYSVVVVEDFLFEGRVLVYLISV